jgi:hypothetical protein
MCTIIQLTGISMFIIIVTKITTAFRDTNLSCSLGTRYPTRLERVKRESERGYTHLADHVEDFLLFRVIVKHSVEIVTLRIDLHIEITTCEIIRTSTLVRAPFDTWVTIRRKTSRIALSRC